MTLLLLRIGCYWLKLKKDKTANRMVYQLRDMHQTIKQILRYISRLALTGIKVTLHLNYNLQQPKLHDVGVFLT